MFKHLTEKTHPQTHTPTESIKICISVVCTLNYLYEVLIRKLSFQKHREASDQTEFFVVSPSCTLLFGLTLAFDRTVLHRNVALSIVALSSKKRCSSLLKKILVFPNTCFKVKILKMFEISSGLHIKIRRCFKRRTILKVPSTIFQRLSFFC